MAAMDADPLVRAVAATGLSLEATPLAEAPLGSDAFRGLVVAVEAKRLQGHLASAVESRALPVTEDQRQAVAERHAAAMAACLRLEELLVTVVDRFEAAGIDHRVLKGSAAAHLDYREPSERCYGDVDLLVQAVAFDDAVAVLTDLGHRRRFPQPRPGFDRRFTKSVTMVGPSGLELDLHRTLAEGPYGMRIDLAQLWGHSQSLTVGGRELRALDPDLRLLHACYHAALGDVVPRLVALRDIATALDRPDEARAGRVLDIADRWCGLPVVARAVTLTSEVLGAAEDPLVSWASQYEPSRRDVRALDAYVGARGSYATRAVAALRAIPGTRQRAAYVWALTFPEASYVDARHASRLARFRSAVARRRRQRGLRTRR